MNKDFFTKPISLKDINLKNINLKNIDLKKIKNKKEIVIGILILIYIIVIICVGSALIKERETTKSEFEAKEAKYNSLKNASSEDEMKEKIESLVLEKDKLNVRVKSIANNEFSEILKDFKKNSPIVLEGDEVSIKNTKEFEDYDIYIVNIKNATGTFKQFEEFLQYVENYERIVRVDTLSFKKNQITGRMTGSIRLSFYFKKLSM